MSLIIKKEKVIAGMSKNCEFCGNRPQKERISIVYEGYQQSARKIFCNIECFANYL